MMMMMKTRKREKIQAKWESGLTTVWLKQDPPVLKEQKQNWPFHLSTSVFVANAMSHCTTGVQPYGLMYGHKDPTVYDAWLGLTNYSDKYLQSKCYGSLNSMTSYLV